MQNEQDAMRLFCAQFVCKSEDVWFSKVPPYEPLQSQFKYWLEVILFRARDEDAAFERASSMIAGFEDANHDGPGDRTIFSCDGVHELEEVHAFSGLEGQLNSPYGLEVAHLNWPGKAGPKARCRDELEITRVQRLSSR